jgi:hypothetical protein
MGLLLAASALSLFADPNETLQQTDRGFVQLSRGDVQVVALTELYAGPRAAEVRAVVLLARAYLFVRFPHVAVRPK